MNKGFKSKKVGVIGLGREGIEAVRFLIEQKALVTVLDQSPVKKLGANYEVAKKLGVNFRLGTSYLQNLHDFDYVVRSPGISLKLPEFKKYKGNLTSTTKIFFDVTKAKLIGVTGTKGKSTTSTLLFHLIKESKKAYLAGNIGSSPLPLLNKLDNSSYCVLELSSFQLEDMGQSPQIAVLLDVVPEHLDRHKTYAEYFKAKQNIFKHQKKNDWLVVSTDTDSGRLAKKLAKGKVLEVSTKKVLRRGVYLEKDEIIYRDAKTGKRMVVAKIGESRLLGAHNHINILYAVAVAKLLNVDNVTIAKQLKSYNPLPHRLELVRRVGKTVFVNDSMATTPEAAVSSIQAFPGIPVSIILGGIYKGGDVTELVKTLKTLPDVSVALIGVSAKQFEGVLKKYAPKVNYKIHKTLKSAVLWSRKEAKDGAVLLAPACSSFDMFKDAYDRGEQFKKIVKSL